MSGARPTVLRPTGLTVLYDAECPMCRRARRWVEGQHQLLPVRFVPAGSALAMQRFPRLEVRSTLADVTVVTDEGAVVRGDQAWIAVLWALARTRPIATKLAGGGRQWMFRNVRGATEMIRRLSRAQADPGPVAGVSSTWAPPRSSSPCGGGVGCGT